DGKPFEFIAESKGGDGQAFGPDGRLYAVANAVNQIIAWDADAKPTVVADGFKGNDLVVRHDGGMFVTDPNTRPNDSKVWFIPAKGEKKEVDHGLRFSNGLALSPDQ